MTLDKGQQIELARLLVYIFANESGDYEETQEEYGFDSDEANNHIYKIASDLWRDLEMDAIKEVT